MGLVLIRKNFTYFKQGTAYVLAIGINKFASFHPLFNAKKDVQDILGVLTQKYQFEEEQVVSLFDKKATRNNIIEELIRFRNTLKEEDSLLILFSGHGAIDKSDPTIGYWIPYDAKRNEVGDYIENFQIKRRLDGIRARHVLIIADSCYSHSMFRGNGGAEDNRRNEILSGIPSRWFLASGRGKVHDGIPGTNSPFAKALLNVLVSNEEDTLRISTVIEGVLGGVDLKYRQIARGERLDMAGHEGGQFVFFKRGNYKLPPPPWFLTFSAKILAFTLLSSIVILGALTLWKRFKPTPNIPYPITKKTVTFILEAEISDTIEVENMRLHSDTMLEIDPSGRTIFTPPEDWFFSSDSIRISWEVGEEDDNILRMLDSLIIIKSH